MSLQLPYPRSPILPQTRTDPSAHLGYPRLFAPRPSEIGLISLSNASFYFFTPSLPSDFPTTPDPDGNLSCSVAHRTLLDLHCSRLEGKEDWTRNHWELILWKLACLCRGKPALFHNPSGAVGGEEGEVEGMLDVPRGEGKFSWDEMMRQLLYRWVPTSLFLPGRARLIPKISS